MLEPTPVGHFSKLGAQTIAKVTSNDAEYLKFLKYFGRVFKHPVSVALEFYSNKPDAQFIASKGQWERADYHVAIGAKGINFLDQKGNLITLYDFEDVIEEIPPKRWSVTQNNVSAIRSQLNLPSDTPLFIELEGSVTSPMDDLSIIQDLGLAALPDTDKLKFRDSYHNMIQVMLTGRLEVNGAIYRIQPDRAALGYCQTDEQKFYLLTAAASAARKALTSLEYAFDTLRTQNEIIRKEANENEIRRMAETQSGRKADSTGSGLSAASDYGTSQRSNISESREEGRTDRLASDTGSRGNETGEMVSGDNNGNTEIGNRNDRAAISSESVGRSVHSDDRVQRTITGGTADRDIRQNVDGEYGEELPGESRNDDVLSQVSDGSKVGGQESGGILRSAERTVQQEQSTSSEQLRGNSDLGDNEEIRDRTPDNDGSSSRTGNDSLNVDININSEIADKWDNLDVIIDNKNGSIDWIYFNPDSLSGGQLVINHIRDEQFEEASRFDSIYDYLNSVADQQLVDIDTSDFYVAATQYLDIADNGNAALVSTTGNSKEIEQFLQNYAKNLKLNNNAYAEYRASLRNTVYTRLNDTQRFKFSHCKYVEEPKNCIWGQIDNAVRINNGIFEVSTASHGGIMIRSEVAKAILSREAQKIAQKEHDWYFYEEDCAYAVALREIVDKDLFSDINSYFSKQYNKTTDDFLPKFNEAINLSLQRWFSSYWDKRETALYNTLSPEEQAEEIGQLSFGDNAAESVEDKEVSAIRSREIQKAIHDIKRRIDNFDPQTGKPQELEKQKALLKFFQSANSNDIELTPESFKSFMEQSAVDANINGDVADKQTNLQALFSVEVNGEQSFYKVSNKSSDDILRIAKSELPRLGFNNIGDKIGEIEYAEIQQSSAFTFSVDINLDTNMASLYSVNQGYGGISEGDRTDDNVSIINIRLSDYRVPYRGLAAEKIPVSASYAISMWENGFPVYLNNEVVPKRNELAVGTDVTELFSDDKVFSAEFGDVKKQQLIDAVSSDISDIDAAMPEEKYIDIRDFVEHDENNVFEWDNGQNVYLNVTKALIDRNMGFIDDYLTAVKNDFDSFRGETAQNRLVEYANYAPPEKECDTVLDLPEYSLSIDLKEIDELYIKDEYSYYEGGIDSDGHERKDNYSRHNRSLTISLDPYGVVYVNSYDDRDLYDPYREKDYDVSDSNEVKALREQVIEFIKTSEDLSITSYNEGKTQDFQVKAAESEAVSADDNMLSSGPIVDGVQVYEALAAEIDRGTGFVNGKIRVQEFYEKSRSIPNHPTTKELAECLKKEYGIGGHSGSGNITMVDYNSKGMTFSFQNGEKFRHSWFDVASLAEYRLRENIYLSPEQQNEWQRIKANRSPELNYEPYEIKIGDQFRQKATHVVSEVVALTDTEPYYKGDYTVKRMQGASEITENVSYNMLLSDLYQFIGNSNDLKAEQEKDNSNTFEIYQVKSGEDYRYYRFTSYEMLHNEGNTVDFNNYELKYTAELVDGTTLEDIYTRFNVEHPDDFTGHSLSVSDVIVVHDDDVTTAYYIDDVGYKKVPEFLQLEQKEDIVEDFQNKNTATTDTPDYSQAIHEGFTALYSSHTYTEKQNKFLKRLENYAANNNVTENIVNTAFEKGAAFRNTYGNKEYISRNLFARRLGSLEKELESNIRAVINPQELEEKIHQVITNAGYDGGVDEKKEYTSFKEALEVGQKYIEDGYLGFAIYNQNTQMIERVEGDFPVTTAFSDEILKINGIDNRKVEVNTVINGNNLENTDALATAKQLINEFCEDEYEISADFSDMHNVALAHTTLTDEQVPVQVTADLLDYKLIYEFGYEVFKTEEFSSIEDMVQNGLTGLDFADLVDVPDELIEKYVPNIKDYYNQYAILSRCKQDCIYAINRAEHIDSIKNLNKYLYLGSVDGCISTMHELYEQLPDNAKPEWLTLEDINEYETQLTEISRNIASNPVDTNINADTSNANTVISIPEYGISVDLKEVDFLYLRDDYTSRDYGGYIDSNGNIALEHNGFEELKILLTKDGEINSEEYISAFGDELGKNIIGGRISEFEIKRVNSKVSHFIRNAEKLEIYTQKGNVKQNIQIKESAVDTNINAETTVDTNINEIEQLTDEVNATTLADVEVGDILLLKEPESGELMYFRIDSFQDNFMVSMSRVADAAGNDFTEIGKASIGIIDGHWRETLLDNNTDSPILRYTKNYQEELKQQLHNNVATNSNEALVEERVHKRASRAEMLYREFTEAYPDIANGTHTYERYGEDYDEYGENDAFEPLSLEYLGDDTYSFMTWYVQNGDLMHDPDFVFTLDHENKELHVWEFQMDGVPAFGTLYERVEQEDGSIDRKLQASLEDNFRTNLRNAIAVKRELTAYTDINGEEHELKSNEPQVKPETPEINDSSAYYREALNSFSEKHGLGELNIKNSDNGFHITEKFKDGISVPIWFISHREPTLLTNNELEKEFELIEKQAERNKTTVSEMDFRERRVEEHGGMTELPMVQDNLPEINFARDPRQKISDNNIALIELNRLRTCEANGRYPFDKGRNDYNSIDNSLARLRGYSGWGGVPQLFDETFSNLKYLRDAIKSRLTPEEYANARRSTLTSHYTPQVIIDAMYKTIRNMGLPKNSRILEPSCGTGNFIARMPHDMGKGGIVGVEIDSITADIAKYLNVPMDNPYADEKDEILRDKRDIKILNCGFERSGLENNSFDLAIGNVPFGEFKLNDPDYTDDWYIHDAFFRKALDKVAPGGIVAFVTSTGTLDKKNPKIREYLATRAELVGAVRLPNNAFADAGTSTSTDIVFLQKRKELLKVHDPKPDWCYTLPVEVEMVGKKYEGEKRTAYINSYFVQNPQMVLGTIKQTTHFDMLTCEPIEGKTLKEQLDIAFRQLNAKISIDKREQSVLEKKGYIEPWGKSFTYQIKDDKVFFNTGNAMEEVETKGKSLDKYKALCQLRDTTRELLEKQVTTDIDYDLTPLRNKLNEQYDSFVKEYGNTTSKAIIKLFRKDADYPILAALESVDPDTKVVTKADIFTRRTVNPIKEITEVDTIEESMQVSLDKKGKIDIGYMSWLLQNKYDDMNISSVAEKIADELLERGLVFKDPAKLATGKPYAAIVDRSEYLCGDVRRKLFEAEQAAAEDSSYAKNVEALKEIIPEDIGATEISADLGCTWIDTEDYEEFIRSLSGRGKYDSKDSSVQFSNVTGQFKVGSARSRSTDIFNTNEISTYGTEDMNMYRIIENLLNQRKVQVFDYIPDPQKEGKLKSVINSYKTKIAQSKAKEIKKAFHEWIFATDERKEKYVKRYNERFNSIVGRSYDGSHLTFTGLSNKFNLRKHQLDCIARSIYGGNTLAAHCVGAGKSAVIAASVMKKKELGLIHKACVVVPKPLTEQTEREWRMSFPDAKLFLLDNKDLSDESKRELFTARVATGDYDAVIMSQEQFEKLAMSPEYQAEYLDKKIAEMRNDLEERKRETGRRDPSVKELEVVIIKTERQIENIMNPKSKSRGKDNLLNFESLGFDYLVADEAHAYKNGYVSTKMGDVQGVNTNESGRSGDMLMKCDYFNNEFGNGHILFATGTPVSNSMSELYVMTRYLRPDLLENCGCSRFDDWVATFGMIKTQNKKTATGELKLKTCFAGFKNRPELMKMYKEFADLVALEKLIADPNSNIVVPKIKGGKPQIIEVDATPEQREIVKDFARRGREIQSGNVRPDEDNLLKITGEARLVGLGNKAVAAVWLKNEGFLPDGFLEDDKSGKIDECVRQTAKRYHDRYDDKAVQIIFSDIAVNSDDGKFSAYEYIRKELIAKGVKADEIIFAPKSDAKNRTDVFRDINEAKYRIVIGSTGTIGTGANIQKHLYALHHLDIPWRPSDFAQREGRIVRQGNLNAEVEILNYVTKGTLDSYLYQGVTDKARGIAQLWNDSNISRTSEDIDEKVLTFGELEAAAEGNPKLREYSELKNKIDEMQVVRSEYNHETTRIERNLKEIPDKLEATKKLLAGAQKDLERTKSMRRNDKMESIEIKMHTGNVTSDRARANKYMADKVSLKVARPLDGNPEFYIEGFKISLATTEDRAHPAFAIQGERAAAYRIECGVGENSDNYQRLLNFFDKGIERQIEKDTAVIEKLNLDYKQSQERVKTPFPGEDEYNNTLKAFEELEHELTAGGFLDNGEELTGADDFKDYETEKTDTNVNDNADMDISEYNSI